MTCLRTVVDDPAYEKLGEALERQDKKEAFDYAHTLKGVLGNMGLTPIYNVVIRIVEPLRNETNENLEQIYEELLAENNRLRRIIEN